MPRVLVVRGHQATPWDLRQWEALPDRFDVAYLRSAANGWDVGSVALEAVPVRTRRDRLPKGRLGDVAALLAGDAYGAGADAAYAGADVVHAEELAYWFAADAARAKKRHGFKLVQTVWETLPMLQTYRRGGLAAFRDDVLDGDRSVLARDRARAHRAAAGGRAGGEDRGLLARHRRRSLRGSKRGRRGWC